MDAVAALKASPLLEGFTDTGLGIIAGICTVRQFPPQSPLFVEAMLSESMFIIAQGRVMLSIHGSQGESPMGELGPGDWLGELSLISNAQRQCTATALAPVVALEIRQSDFQKLMSVKPQACMKLLMSICTKFGEKVVENKDALKSLVTR